MDVKRVLLISGDEATEEKIKEEFDCGSFFVETVKNPALALEMLKNNDYYIIVADVSSAGLSVYEMLHRMNIFQYYTPVVLVSGVMSADNILLAYELGALDILSDDFKKGEVISVIEKALNPVI